jgi:hypothetical protein
MTPADLRIAMGQLGWSVADLSRIFGVTERGVYKWLSGAVPVPRYVMLLVQASLDGLIPIQWLADRLKRQFVP